MFRVEAAKGVIGVCAVAAHPEHARRQVCTVELNGEVSHPQDGSWEGRVLWMRRVEAVCGPDVSSGAEEGGNGGVLEVNQEVMYVRGDRRLKDRVRAVGAEREILKGTSHLEVVAQAREEWLGGRSDPFGWQGVVRGPSDEVIEEALDVPEAKVDEGSSGR